MSNRNDVRQYVREMLGIDNVYEPEGDVNVSSVVDPLSVETVPANPNFTPQDHTQFQVAFQRMIRNVPDEKIPKLYDIIKDAIDEVVDEDEEKQRERDTSMKNNKLNTETVIRKAIRKMLQETEEPEETLGGDPDDPSYGRPATFKEIAEELGFSVAGAKQAVDKALQKAAFLAQQMEEPERDIMTLEAIKDYIYHLQSSGELTPADAQLMADHPGIVSELDGFREFLHKYVKRRMRGV